MKSLLAMIESFIPESFREDSALYTRARFLVTIIFLLSGLGLVYNLIYFKVGNAYGGIAIIAMVSVLFFLPYYLKKTGNLTRTMHLCSFCLTLMMGTIMFTSGGAVFSGNPWWTLTPVFTTLVVGGKAGRTWMFIVSGILGGTYLIELIGFKFPDFISHAPEVVGWVRFLDWFHYFGAIFVITAACLVFDHINRQALIAELDTRKQVEETSKHVEEHNLYLDESVARILKEMEKLAEGDLTSNLDIVKRDAIGQLCEGFIQAVCRVHETIAQVNQAVNVTTDTSHQIGESTGKLAEDACVQTEKAGELADSTSKMVEIITKNADSARSTAEAARENGSLASEGETVVRQTVKKMEEIAQVVNQSSSSIESLEQSTDEIGQIVSVIRGIAEKTNLLALNAAIEASHAGEKGRGFGVIAEEVKDLAYATTVETQRIAEMIDKVQAETNLVIKGMRTGSKRVLEGKDLANHAGRALEQIMESSDRVCQMISLIAEASEEQTKQSGFLFKQIEDLRAVTDNSAHEINGIAKSATNLEERTSGVADLLHHFKLADEH